MSSGGKAAAGTNSRGLAVRRIWRRTGQELDALNMVGVEEPHGGPVGNSTEFPVCSDLDDGQILVVFVTVVASLTGGVLEYCLMPKAV